MPSWVAFEELCLFQCYTCCWNGLKKTGEDRKKKKKIEIEEQHTLLKSFCFQKVSMVSIWARLCSVLVNTLIYTRADQHVILTVF